MKTAGLLTNGGDTCSLNALLAYSRDALRDEGLTKIYGFAGGYRGLITCAYDDVIGAAIDPHSGGTCRLSLRDSPTPSERDRAEMEAMTEQERKREERLWEAKLQGALKTLRDLHIDVLVVLGGNGTIAATVDFAQHVPSQHKIICLPRTIDNDVDTGTAHIFQGREIPTALCPGYPSAAAKVVEATRSLRTTARSTKRIFTLETMGRDAGWLALASSLGWAEVVTIPEVNLVGDSEQNARNKEERRAEGKPVPEHEVGMEHLCRLVAAWYERGNANNVIIGVSEGTMLDCQQITMTQYGTRKLGGAGDALLRVLREYVCRDGVLCRRVCPNGTQGDADCEIIEMPEVRCQRTDYGPRMGEPATYDVELANVLAYRKLRAMLLDGEFGRMPVLTQVLTEAELREQGTAAAKTVDIADVRQMALPVDAYYDPTRLISTKAFDDFLYKIVGEGLVRQA